ncbi:unnamed protein product [Anisakis simplex]|uniref:SH2 domain-containing protein n=1 Tax=Anisakis simplex TaxID=6269 RepID=A0A0M3J9N5_ANISI|nr:unnamed protein product [Anisakis simplex]
MSVATASSPNYDVPRPSAECALRLEAWYHGQLTRVRAESLVRAEGDFLVRFGFVYTFTMQNFICDNSKFGVSLVANASFIPSFYTIVYFASI